MDTVLYAEINIFSIAVLLMVAFRASVTKAEQPFKNKIFSLSVWFATAANIFDLLWNLSNSQRWNFPLPIVLGINFMYFMCFGFSSYFWFLYSELITKKDVLKRSHLIKDAIPLAILMVLLIVSMFNGCLFYFDENMVYHKGPLYYWQGILSYGYIVISAVKSLIEVAKGESYTRREELLSVASFAVPLLLSVVMQLFYQDAPIMTLGVSVSYLLVYINTLNMLVSVDPLTGISNRREFLKSLEEKIFSLKKDEKLCFMFIDIDSFKQINDKYGHNEGDRALKMVASVLKSVCSKNGCFCARYGGDEFAVIQPFKKDTDVERLQNKISDLIEQKHSETNSAYKLGVSIGCAYYPEQADNIQDLICYADSDMYDVKIKRKKLVQ